MKERHEVWTNHSEKNINVIMGDVLEGPENCVCRDEVAQMADEMKIGEAPETSEVSLECFLLKGKCDFM